MSKFVVTDEDGTISWNGKSEKPESFSTFAAAEKRAQALAELAPGQSIRIYEFAAIVIVPTSPAKTLRAKQKHVKQ